MALTPEQIQAIYSDAASEASALYPGVGALLFYTPQVFEMGPPPAVVKRIRGLVKLAIPQLSQLPKLRYYFEQVILNAVSPSIERIRSLIKYALVNTALLPKTRTLLILTLKLSYST